MSTTERYGPSQYVRSLPSVLRDVVADLRLARQSGRDLLPFVWRLQAMREQEHYGAELFELGRTYELESHETPFAGTRTRGALTKRRPYTHHDARRVPETWRASPCGMKCPVRWVPTACRRSVGGIHTPRGVRPVPTRAGIAIAQHTFGPFSTRVLTSQVASLVGDLVASDCVSPAPCRSVSRGQGAVSRSA